MGRLKAKLTPEPGAEDVELWTGEALSTARIEGEELVAESVRSSAARRLRVSNARTGKKDSRGEALLDLMEEATTRIDEPLTLERLCAWQKKLFAGHPPDPEILLGRLRGDEPMRVISSRLGEQVKIHYEAPPKISLPDETNRLLAWFNAPPVGLDGYLRAGVAHLWLVMVHPFDDGNGRIARLLTERALAQAEGESRRMVSLSKVLLADRKGYYAVLEKTGRGGVEITDWLQYFLKALNEAASLGENTLASAALKAGFWARHHACDLSARQKKGLNRMLDEEPQGFRGGMTPRQYASLTGCSVPTASLDLRDLRQQGILRLGEGKGRSTAYHLEVAGKT